MLGEALSTGQLSHDEHSERLDTLYQAREVEITINAIFGWAEIVVPEGVEVRCHGTGIFGGFDVHGSPDVDPSAPVVVVKGLALFGRVGGKARLRRDH